MMAMLSISACGSGGGGGGTAATQPTTAIVKLITSGTGTTIYGIDVTVGLPAGVTVKNSAITNETADGVVTPSGAAASGTIAAGVYTAATITMPAKVRILIANASGFTTGEFCAVNSDVIAGYAPKASDFTLVSFAASDQSGNIIAGLTPSFTVDIQ